MTQLDRLREKALRAGLHGPDGVWHGAMSGDHDHDRILVADSLQHLEAVEVGQAHIEQHQIWVRPPNGCHPVLSAMGARHLVPRVLEVHSEGRGVRFLVVDDQYAGHVWMQGCGCVGSQVCFGAFCLGTSSLAARGSTSISSGVMPSSSPSAWAIRGGVVSMRMCRPLR